MQRPKIKRQGWTVVLIPHSGHGRVNNLSFPAWLVRGSLSLLLFAVVAGIFLLASYREKTRLAEKLQPLAVVNRQQEQQIRELEVQVQAVHTELQDVQELKSRVREMVGLQEEAPGGVGGAARDQSPSPREASRGFSTAGEVAVGARTSNIQDLQKNLSGLTEELKNQQVELQKLAGEVEARQKELAAFPDHWPVTGRITSSFGNRRNPFGGGYEFHDGIDIDSRVGDPVMAAGDGVVVFAAWDTGYGRRVTIEHGYGYRTSYAHNSKILVEVGQKVQKGQVIARVGSSGRSTGPHMHFMVEFNRRLINPLQVMQ